MGAGVGRRVGQGVGAGVGGEVGEPVRSLSDDQASEVSSKAHPEPMIQLLASSALVHSRAPSFSHSVLAVS